MPSMLTRGASRLLHAVVFFAAAAAASAAQAEIRIVAIGDSQIAGRGVASDQAYPAQLERALRAKGYDVAVQNSGINGDTTAGVLARLDSTVPNGTTLAIVVVGGRDLAKGSSQAEVRGRLDEIRGRLRARGIPAIVMTGPEFQGALGNRPDLHVESSRVLGNYHLTAEGLALVVKRTLPQVEALIGHAKHKGA